MKYRELIQFDPIIDVVQLQEANKAEDAKRLVLTYVLSEQMGNRLIDVVVPNLQYEKPADNKGLLVVGNYGTGKSHLMSVLTTIAETAEAPSWLQGTDVSSEFTPIAGKFKVFRTELGGITMSLREFLFRKLEAYLDNINVDYKFPPLNDIESNKDCLMEMMARFQDVHPDKGLLVAVDELLDYLRTRKEQDLYMDLNLLRELGEVCHLTRFRFMSGVQETLFENPKFQFVAETLKRVRDRFETVTIAKQDVAYVVSNRLLKKDDRQRDLIRTRLEKYAPYFTDMNEKLEQYVNLFPVHPAYLDVFEGISVVEKREVLKTISRTITKKLEEELPEQEPGIISYDSYWDYLKDDPSLRSDPEIQRVVECNKKLEGIIETADLNYQKPLAFRIIKALSVYRLTTDINAPIGLTAKNLRDQLTIFIPGQLDDEFLLATVESVLQNIMKTVSGQFISINKQNQQYYLDVDKDTDYDALVAEKADTLTEDKLNHYYFDLLINVLRTGDSMFTGFKIWEFELEWNERKSTRQGWLFFGAPHERSTAQPPKDFYIYFLKLYGPQGQVKSTRADEVFFVLENKEQRFLDNLRLYAGARELEATSSVENKIIYKKKVEEYRKNLNTWLTDNIVTAFKVHYAGTPYTFTQLSKGANRGLDNRELIKLIASNCLSSYFAEITPTYPTFPFTHCITQANRADYTLDALRWISNVKRTDTGARIMEGLDLIHNGEFKPAKSRYTGFILDNLPREAESVQVVNRTDLIKDIQGIEYSSVHRLEPEWVVVLLAALVHSGDIVISYPGKEINATNLDEMHRMPIQDLINFKYIRRPGKFPLKELLALFNHLGINETLIRLPDQRPEGISAMNKAAGEKIEIIARLIYDLGQGIKSFGVDLLNQADRDRYRKEVDAYKAFLEKLSYYNTPAKLANFKATENEIAKFAEVEEIIAKIKRLSDFKSTIEPLAGYLQQAELLMSGSDWATKVKNFRTKILLPTLGSGDVSPADQKKLEGEIRALKREYIETYIELHRNNRLNAEQDNRKKQLMQDTKLEALRKLKDIRLMPKGELDTFVNRLANLRTCYSLDKGLLENSPVCSCGFKPSEEKEAVTGAIDQLRDQLETMYSQWQENLHSTLQDPSVARNFELLKPNVRKRLEDFMESKTLPEDLDTEFINAVIEVLGNMKRVDIHISDLSRAMLEGGSPCTVEDLRRRFERFLHQQTQGTANDARIILHEEEQQ